jgi:deoxyribose-phosphate aldolase
MENEHDLIKLAVTCLDYTSLGDNDTEDDVRTLCQQAITPLGNVAAICVWPQFVDFAKRELADPSINIATVVNFPQGDQPLAQVIEDTKKALFDGANEIDLVLPYKQYIAGEKEAALNYVTSIKEVCGDNLLKVIIESGELDNPTLIAEVSLACLNAGADFIKTSTGKTKYGASLEAATQMLSAISSFRCNNKQKTVGLKVSGGIRTLNQATDYIRLAQMVFGKDGISPHTFRIGASSLLQVLLNTTS